MNPRLSLVVATLGRVDEIARLFRSLDAQTFRDFDVTIVDQNDDDRLAVLEAQRWSFPLRRLRTPGERGASRGRNRGWQATTGEIVLFPDDDCWYPADFLARAVAIFDATACDVLGGRPADETGRTINGRFQPAALAVDRRTVWTTAMEWMVFFRRTVLERTGGFDEGVGVGAATPWQSAEIQDIILRALAAGFACRYDPDLIGHHPEDVAGPPDARARYKARVYARGMGHVLRTHGYGLSNRGSWVLRPVAGSALSLLRGRAAMARWYAQVAIGRLEGFTGRARALRRP
jgi:glycosyltransferase involved in cell wall biosynthesis